MAAELTFTLHATQILHLFAAAQPAFFWSLWRCAPLLLMDCCSIPFCHYVASALHATLLQREPLRCTLRCIPLSRGVQRGQVPRGGNTPLRWPSSRPIPPPKKLGSLEATIPVWVGRASPPYKSLHKFYLWGSASELKDKQNEHDIGF